MNPMNGIALESCAFMLVAFLLAVLVAWLVDVFRRDHSKRYNARLQGTLERRK